MPENRFFINKPLEIGSEYRLEEEESLHFSRSMRGKKGQKVEIINGKGSLAHATVVQTDKKGTLIHVDDIVHEKAQGPCIHLIQAIPKINRLDIILEKGTELGMSDIYLFPGDLSEKKQFSHLQKERMERILINATKQCGRLYVPTVHFKPSLDQWLRDDLPAPAFFGDVREKAPLLKDALKEASTLSFVIGPEAGFSKREIEKLESLGAKGVSLHHNILKADTAPLAALAIVSHLLMK